MECFDKRECAQPSFVKLKTGSYYPMSMYIISEKAQVSSTPLRTQHSAESNSPGRENAWNGQPGRSARFMLTRMLLPQCLTIHVDCLRVSTTSLANASDTPTSLRLSYITPNGMQSRAFATSRLIINPRHISGRSPVVNRVGAPPCLPLCKSANW